MRLSRPPAPSRYIGRDAVNPIIINWSLPNQCVRKALSIKIGLNGGGLMEKKGNGVGGSFFYLRNNWWSVTSCVKKRLFQNLRVRDLIWRESNR